MNTSQVLATSAFTAVALVLTASRPAHAATVQVNGTCTLREAFQTVNDQYPAPGCAFTNPAVPSGCTYPGGSDLILVPNGVFTETTWLELNRSAWICGNGVGATTLRGNSTTSSFFLRVVNPDGGPFRTVTFERLTIDHTAGSAFVTGIYAYQSAMNLLKVRVAGFGGGGIWGQDSHIIIDDSTIENNSSAAPGGGIRFESPSGNGGVNAELNIYRSTIANNTSTDAGGGLYYAGFGNSDLVNVTFSGNRATAGGAIFKEPWSNYLLFWFTTVAFNTATTGCGGGVAIPDVQTLQGAQLVASIVAQNVAPSSPDLCGQVNNFKESLIGNDSGVTITDQQSTGIVNVAANLDPVLRDLGGPYRTRVHRPFPNSPAIDAVFDPPNWSGTDVENMDQRHVLRPQLGSWSPAVADMGAVESDRLETEALILSSASAPHVVVSGSAYSNGQGTNLQATGTNQFVIYATSGAVPGGTYKIKIGYKRGSNAGRFQFAVSNMSTGPFTSIGPTQEGYYPFNSWATATFNNVSFSGGATMYFRFYVTGRNLSSSGYQIFPDFIEVTRQ